MAITMEQVRAALDPDEPRYEQAARELGPDALPHLEEIIRRADEGMAAKAVYLASLIGHDRAAAVVESGAERPEAAVRVAVAAGAQNLATGRRSPVLLRLLDDDDFGVKKVALRAVPRQPEPALAAKVAALAGAAQDSALRGLARQALEQS